MTSQELAAMRLVEKILMRDLNEEEVEEMICRVSSCPLGPESLDGVYLWDIPFNDEKAAPLRKKLEQAEIVAFEIIQGTDWYRNDEWPNSHSALLFYGRPTSSFRGWVDYMSDLHRRLMAR